MASNGLARDVRLDVFRGLALLIIFMTHIPGLVYAGLTPHAFGYADAADAFVLIAGIAACLAYAPKFAEHGALRGSMPIFTRVWQLYVTHITLVILITGVMAYAARQFGDPNYLELLGLDVMLNDPVAAVHGIVTLTFLPGFLDILPLYVALLAGLPLMLKLVSIHWALALVPSFALYVAVQMTGWNLPNIQAASVWFFNPLAWQFLFVIGVVVAHLKVTGGLAPLFANRRVVRAITVLCLAYAGFTLLAAAPWRQIPALANVVVLDGAILPVVDKTNQSPARLIDALAKFWLIAVLVDRSAAWLSSTIGRTLALVGRHSLPVFVLGLVLSMCGMIATREADYAMWAQTLVMVTGCAILIGFAALLDWQGRAGRRDAAVPAPAAVAPARVAAPLATSSAS